MRACSAWVAVIACLSFGSSGFAQARRRGSPPAPAPAQPQPQAPPQTELPDDDGSDTDVDVRPPSTPDRPATAATSGLTFDQIVVLRGGTTLRCAVIEMVPDVRYVVVMPTGESRTIPAAEVERVEQYQAPPPAGTTVATAVATPGAEVQLESTTPPPRRLPRLLEGVVVPPGRSGGRRVRIRSEDGRRLEVGFGDPQRRYESLCGTPCELRLERGRHRLRFSAPGVVPYTAELDTRARALDVMAEAPSRVARTAGTALAVVGVLAIVAGGVVLIAGAGQDDSTPFVAGGLSSLGAGVGLAVAGGSLLSASAGGVVVRSLDP